MDSILLTELEPGRAFGGRPRSEAGPAEGAVPTAELADCTCPDFCERDHDNE
jgi:hypothetical protein